MYRHISFEVYVVILEFYSTLMLNRGKDCEKWELQDKKGKLKESPLLGPRFEIKDKQVKHVNTVNQGLRVRREDCIKTIDGKVKEES